MHLQEPKPPDLFGLLNGLPSSTHGWRLDSIFISTSYCIARLNLAGVTTTDPSLTFVVAAQPSAHGRSLDVLCLFPRFYLAVQIPSGPATNGPSSFAIAAACAQPSAAASSAPSSVPALFSGSQVRNPCPSSILIFSDLRPVPLMGIFQIVQLQRIYGDLDTILNTDFLDLSPIVDSSWWMRISCLKLLRLNWTTDPVLLVNCWLEAQKLCWISLVRMVICVLSLFGLRCQH